MNDILKKRKQLNLSNFKGFDFSSSPINTDSCYSVNGKNFIYRNGVNSKRNGYDEVLRISRLQSGEIIYSSIDGIYEFNLDGNNFVICYSGNHFYQIMKSAGNYYSYDITFTSSKPECMLIPLELSANKLFLFKNNNAIYFVGAGKLIVFKRYEENYELRYVENNDETYIPLTTKNITPIGEEDLRENNEEPNILSKKRINEFKPITITLHDTKVWKLDVDFVDLTKEFIVEIEYEYNGHTVSDVFRKNSNNHIISDLSAWDFGTISSSGELSLTNEEGILDNILSMKAHFSTSRSDKADRINKCKIGTLFGKDSKKDILFISKNGIKDNEDYMSESEDFTYFRDNCISKIGSEDSKVMSYILLNDGTLAIMKERVNGESCIYYRINNSDFTIKTGTIGEGVISSYATATLGEEKLFLGKNGVFSLVLTKNLSSDNRYARERSYYINSKLLKNHNLQDAFAIIYDNKYFLVINQEVYIADMRFINLREDNMNDTYNFDWWYWDNIPASCMSVIDDKLWFGTEDGRICVFDDTFTDKTYNITEDGDILIDYTNNRMIVNQNLNIKDETKFIFTSSVYSRLLSENDILRFESGKFFTIEEKFRVIRNNSQVILKYNGEEHLCYITESDAINHCFELYENSVKITSVPENYDMDILITNIWLKLNGEKVSFCNGGEVLFAENSHTVNMVKAKMLSKKNVVAEWFTPMLDMGLNNMKKTLLKLSVTTHSPECSKMEIGYSTRYHSYYQSNNSEKEFNVPDIDFTNFTFLTSFATSYTIDLKEDFNFIQFFVKSDSNSDCTLEDISVLYKVNGYNRGNE